MSLIRWTPRSEQCDPFAGLADIQNEVNRLLNHSLPPVDVLEDKESFLVRADLPGLSKDDVSATLEDNILMIKGEKKSETESKEAGYLHREREHGVFARGIQLPTEVDASKIEAHFRDGVLYVRLPKTEAAKPKQIDVKVN